MRAIESCLFFYSSLIEGLCGGSGLGGGLGAV